MDKINLPTQLRDLICLDDVSYPSMGYSEIMFI